MGSDSAGQSSVVLTQEIVSRLVPKGSMSSEEAMSLSLWTDDKGVSAQYG